MYIICGWYSLIMLIAGIITTIGKDGVNKTEYTGVYKVITVLLNIPMLYFVWATVFM